MKNTIALLVLFFSISAFAQIHISGYVKDSNGNPLELANVVAINTTDNSLEGYAVTTKDGEYKINISKPTTIQLKASYLGYDSQTKILVISDTATVKDFVLRESKNALEGVEVTYEMPVSIKGDTIVYNADSFTSGHEKKLGDVLKKLPGVEVNADGEIEVEGKAVKKVMVEGKDFFDGDSKLATKNIPADAVKKVEILKNYNEVSQMQGLGDNSDNIAINIKLKEGKKAFWFGEVTAGGGNGDAKTRYLAHPKLFYYSPKKSINVLTDMNNIGEIPFTFRDYFKFTGGFKKMMKSGGINISSNSLGLSFLKDNKAKEISNKFAAINFSQSINKHLDFNGFAIFSGATNELQTNSSKTITATNLIENTQDVTTQNNNLGLLKLSFSYKPKLNFQWDYDVLTKFSKLTENNTTKSLALSGNDEIFSSKYEKPFSINQNTNIYYTLNDKNIFSFSGQYLFEQNNPLYNAVNSLQRFAALPTDNTVSKYNISQYKASTTSQLQGTLDYYYILNKKSNLNFTLGTVLNTQKFQSNIYQTLDDNTKLDFSNASLNNDVYFSFSDVFLGLHYKLQTGIFTLTPGISAHQYVSKNTQLGIVTKQSPFYLLPDFTAKITFKRSESIRLNYGMTTDFTDIYKLSEGILFNSYNSLSFGNKTLSNALYHKYGMRYYNFNSFNNIFINGGITYTKKENSIKSVYPTPITIDRKNTYLNSIDPEANLTAQFRISKRFGKIKAKVSSQYSLSNTYRLTNQQAVKVSYSSQNYTASVTSNFNKWPNFELGYKTSINAQNGKQSSSYKPYGNIEIVFLKSFILRADYSYNQFVDYNKNSNTYAFLNTDLYYQKEGSQWEYKLAAINLLDTQSINTDYFSTDIITTSQYLVQGRYLMFTVKYDL